MQKTKLFLLWLAIGALPVSGQTAANFSGGVTDQIGAALPDMAAVTRNVDPPAEKTGADGVYKFPRLASGDSSVKFIAALSKPADDQWGFFSAAAKTSGLNQAQAGETPAAATPASDALTWHGITLYGAYDIGLGWVSHGPAPKMATTTKAHPW